jgi:cell shape-determining protein MreC
MSDNDAGDNNPTDRDESSETKEAPVEELSETVSEVIEVNETLRELVAVKSDRIELQAERIDQLEAENEKLRKILGIQDTKAALNYGVDQ